LLRLIEAVDRAGVDPETIRSIPCDRIFCVQLADAPLFDLGSRVARAWVAGREVSLRDRQRRLYERYRGR